MPPIKTPPPGKGVKLTGHLKDYLAAAIHMPLEDWPGNCHLVATKIVNSGWVQGIARYGHWRGGASPASRFAWGQYAPFVQHGWILLSGASAICYYDGQDGQNLLDPTRWTFESSDPRHAYLYLGWEEEDEYDPGGNVWRSANERPCPEPRSGAGSKPVDLDLDLATKGLVLAMLDEPEQIVVDHVFWLANLSLTTLGPIARPLYEAIEKSRLKAAIPVDNWTMVMVDRTFDPLARM